MYLVGARKQEIPGATLLGNAVDVTWKRNDLILKHPRERPFHQTVAGRIEWPHGQRPMRTLRQADDCSSDIRVLMIN
jgi:hypothetical protein